MLRAICQENRRSWHLASIYLIKKRAWEKFEIRHVFLERSKWYGLVAEWLRRGLQILPSRFDSGRGLHKINDLYQFSLIMTPRPNPVCRWT